MARDLSVRITSELSQQSGQVEPRAEFESLLLSERLRLRYQAPLSGGRGQKAQAELGGSSDAARRCNISGTTTTPTSRPATTGSI